MSVFFFFNDTATTEIYTLSLHDALPIWGGRERRGDVPGAARGAGRPRGGRAGAGAARPHGTAGERVGRCRAPLRDREGQAGTRNAERGTRTGRRVRGLAQPFSGSERRHAGRAAARLAGSLAARAAVEHGADHPADRRGAERRGGRAARQRRATFMCGIVGYTGPRQAAQLLLDGLKRLEYRGYDSAGLALVRDGQIEVHKAPGKISVLEQELGSRDRKSVV